MSGRAVPKMRPGEWVAVAQIDLDPGIRRGHINEGIRVAIHEVLGQFCHLIRRNAHGFSERDVLSAEQVHRIGYGPVLPRVRRKLQSEERRVGKEFRSPWSRY